MALPLKFQTAVSLNCEELLEAVHPIEAVSYPLDEGASYDSLKFRLSKAPDFFLVMTTDTSVSDRFSNIDVGGYVCGTLTDSEILKDETMTTHIPNGHVLCIHSVVVRPDLRRQGLAKQMVRDYVDTIRKSSPHVTCMMLVAKKELVSFYAGCGFSLLGESQLEHGKETWYDMKLVLNTLPLACVDAFVTGSRGFTGNPAAVVWQQPDSNDDEGWMQQVGAQINLSETAFVKPLNGLRAFQNRFEESKDSSSSIIKLVQTLKEAVSSSKQTDTKFEFSELIRIIDESFVHHPCEFVNNGITNSSDSNQGSCKVLALAKALNLSKAQTLLLWGEHYDGVLGYPQGSSHSNIRALISGSLDAVSFLTPIYPLELRLQKTSSETVPLEEMDVSRYSLRWYTPNKEVTLCGHATLGAAYALWHCPGLTQGRCVHPTRLEFQTQYSGDLTVTRDLDQPSTLNLDFPQHPPSQLDKVPNCLLEGLGIMRDDVIYIGSNSLDTIIEINSGAFQQLEDIKFGKLSELDTRCIIVTCAIPDDGTIPIECDFVSRVFAPRYGVDEDPVCGSAHCCLGPYWAKKLSKPNLVAYQASARTGVLRLQLHDNLGRITLAGEGRVCWEGQLYATTL